MVLLQALAALRDAVALVHTAPVLQPPEQPPQPAADGGGADDEAEERGGDGGQDPEISGNPRQHTPCSITFVAESQCGGGWWRLRWWRGVGEAGRFSRGTGRETGGYVGRTNGVATRVVRRERTKFGFSFLFVDSKLNPINRGLSY